MKGPAAVRRPLIAVTGAYRSDQAEHFLPAAYTQALTAAGALPLIVPVGEAARDTDRLLDQFDGWLLPGGGDMDPAYFGAEPVPGMGEITPERDTLERHVVDEVLAADRPLLAICRGAQVLNAAAGGTVIQDLQAAGHDEIKHMQEAPGWYPTHAVELVDSGWLASWFNAHRRELALSAHKELTASSPNNNQRVLRVNSFHHQGIGETAPPLRVTARSRDGLAEAVESKEHRYVVGVQWHPERMTRIPGFAGLFEQFVAAVRDSV